MLSESNLTSGVFLVLFQKEATEIAKQESIALYFSPMDITSNGHILCPLQTRVKLHEIHEKTKFKWTQEKLKKIFPCAEAGDGSK